MYVRREVSSRACQIMQIDLESSGKHLAAWLTFQEFDGHLG
jgi:hypothetical protein